MILLIELLVVGGVTAVAVNWWVAWQRQQRAEAGPAEQAPAVGSPSRLRWLLKEGRLSDAARETTRRLVSGDPPAAEGGAPPAERPAADALNAELEQALEALRSTRERTPEAEQLPPLTRDERRLIAEGDRLAAIRAYMERTGASLDAAMSTVARTAQTALDAPEYALTPTEQRLLVEGNIITVIKLVRERTGLSLLRAKDLVERKLRELE